jgi:hypothetical protein
VISQQGFWAPANSITFYECFNPAACLPGGNGSRTTCAAGYDGVVCSVCATGYFEQFGRHGRAAAPPSLPARSLSHCVFMMWETGTRGIAYLSCLRGLQYLHGS